MYAIVDIETTGSGSLAGITEIAIFRHDGTKVVDCFHSLINPEMFIPSYITQITGIDNHMVRHAPTFAQVQDQVRNLTKDAWFVAHNAHFDYGFIKRGFQSIEEFYERDLLCTVKLSRKIFPGHRSYSLGNLCESLSIRIENRHRAQGDAKATVVLFEMLLKNDVKNLIPIDRSV